MKPSRVAESTSRRSPWRRHLLLLCALLAPGTALALSSDRQQPIEIEADFAELDDEEGTTVYIGNVVVVQGSLRMTGDRLRVNFTPERELKDAYLEGRLATFKQTPDEGKEDVDGEAITIEYHALENMIHLIEKAKVTQGERLTQGHRINYDTARSIVTVRSARATSADKDEQPKESAGRVRIIIPPKKKEPGDATADTP
ncbi:MAG: lipopolysaccharide transport periplasmic protein LptA [Gammaproteobacteria bacterium]